MPLARGPAHCSQGRVGLLGAIIPDILKPGALAENTMPTRYQYLEIDGRTVLIDPQTRKVVHIIER
ncbi:MAG: DUF1236 domain-containing protein [Phyllobacterium sp.]|uniref:DUF1236 domain-containing protein n=1 Tax=Phyllobacterium sp. TaxID=1871046 RepID=UPI0030F1D300